MRTDFQHLLIDQNEGVCTITLNRPEVRNAFNDVMLDELYEAVAAAAQEPAVRCVVIGGTGGAFGSGQDLRALMARPADGSAGKVSEHLHKYHRVVHAIREMPKPVIAAIDGVAAGASCNIALACDMRFVSERARFIEAFARIGLVPDAGGAYFLPRLVGLGKAMELAMLADEVSGAEAARLGLANYCVPEAEFASALQAFARRLAKGPTRTYGLIKELVNKGAESDLSTILKLEGEFQDIAIESADHREGVAAFLQKRPAQYRGE